MRTLKVTLSASAWGWLAGFASGTIILWPFLRETGGISGFLLYEYFLAWGVAVAMLPVCGCAVVPLVHRLLVRSWLWSPWWAAGIGGVAGWLALGVWMSGICAIAGRSISETGAVMFSLLGVTAFAVGAATGAGGARAARIY